MSKLWNLDSKLSESGSKLPDSKKPVVIALLGSTLVEQAAQTFQRANVPTYPFPERAASALSALFKRAEYLDDRQSTINHQRSSIVLGPSSSIDELLTAYEIPAASIKLAHDENEAITIANELGYPVVMKIASSDILHKSDVGGVVLNIKNAESAQRAYAADNGKG